jgi:hypothetical protein
MVAESAFEVKVRVLVAGSTHSWCRGSVDLSTGRVRSRR